MCYRVVLDCWCVFVCVWLIFVFCLRDIGRYEAEETDNVGISGSLLFNARLWLCFLKEIGSYSSGNMYLFIFYILTMDIKANAGKLPCAGYIYCDESAASPLIISTPRPLIAALHQAPDGSGCVREEGRCNSQVWRRVMRHTPEVNGASSPPLLYAGCASPLETGLFPVHARWCPRGSRKGALREQLPHPYTADGPGCRAVSSPEGRGPEEEEPLEEAAALALRTREGSACGRRTPPLTWTLPSRTLPSFTIRVHNEDTRPPVYFGHFIPLGHF